MQEWR
jgi:hypothetical protein